MPESTAPERYRFRGEAVDQSNGQRGSYEYGKIYQNGKTNAIAEHLISGPLLVISISPAPFENHAAENSLLDASGEETP